MKILPWLLSLQSQTAKEFSADPHAHHMAAPQSPYEFMLVALGALITLLVVVYTIKYFVQPKEQGAGHIKRRILGDNF